MLSAERSVMVLENPFRGDRCCNLGHKGEKTYRIAAPGPKVILEAKENKDCCCRACSCFCQRDFSVDVGPPGAPPAYVIDHKTICCSWFSCCACCRHRASVTRTRDRKVIGTVSNDCKLCCTCYPEFTVKETDSTTGVTSPIFRMTKDVNCCAALCGGGKKFCCCKCQVPEGFTIKTLSGPRKGSEGEFHRMADDRAQFDNSDSFSLNFPPDAHEEQRILLVAASLIVDYTVYDNKVEEAKPTPQTMA